MMKRGASWVVHLVITMIDDAMTYEAGFLRKEKLNGNLEWNAMDG
jgi:hypothetical protein